ncbi:hypothetical protein AB6A40_001127 [Gnathostoma spinigerum]|uniref:Copper transport protein n=1 Tax=Gnathostoma spinigerum TaxID=75299 RepID=A0ABD6E3M6_9BILA
MPMHGTGVTHSDGTAAMPMKKHHMWMWFHTTIDETVLFEFWTIDTTWKMVIGCSIVIFLGILFEFIKRARAELRFSFNTIIPQSSTYGSRLISLRHIVLTLLFTIQTVVGYLLMLIFMTFSLWLGLAVTVGVTIGYLVFENDRRKQRCHNSPPPSKPPEDFPNPCC